MEKIYRHIQTKMKVSEPEFIIGLQILFYCYSNKIWLNKSHFDILMHIALNGYDKKNTLKQIVQKSIYKSDQAARNARRDLVKLGLLEEYKKREYRINPKIGIYPEKYLYYEVKVINT